MLPRSLDEIVGTTGNAEGSPITSKLGQLLHTPEAIENSCLRE